MSRSAQGSNSLATCHTVQLVLLFSAARPHLPHKVRSRPGVPRAACTGASDKGAHIAAAGINMRDPCLWTSNFEMGTVKISARGQTLMRAQ